MTKKTKPSKPAAPATAKDEDKMPEIYVTVPVQFRITMTPNAKRGSVHMWMAETTINRTDDDRKTTPVGSVGGEIGGGLCVRIAGGPNFHLAAKDAWIALQTEEAQAAIAEGVVKFEDWAGRMRDPSTTAPA